MSQDLFFGRTKRNWSREPAASNPEFAVQAAATRQTNQIARLTTLKAAADKGDPKAKKKWARLSKKVVKLHVKAAKGNVKAAKTLAALTPTGLFVTTVGPKTLKTTMKGYGEPIRTVLMDLFDWSPDRAYTRNLKKGKTVIEPPICLSRSTACGTTRASRTRFKGGPFRSAATIFATRARKRSAWSGRSFPGTFR